MCDALLQSETLYVDILKTITLMSSATSIVFGRQIAASRLRCEDLSKSRDKEESSSCTVDHRSQIPSNFPIHLEPDLRCLLPSGSHMSTEYPSHFTLEHR